MQEKFVGLSKALRWVIVLLSWVVTIGGFVGCLLIKQYAELPWLEIILTLLGMLFCAFNLSAQNYDNYLQKAYEHLKINHQEMMDI